MKKLYLSANKLSSLDADIFDDLDSLTLLTLASNGLSSLDVDIFDDLDSLSRVYLSDNRLTCLPENLYKKDAIVEEEIRNLPNCNSAPVFSQEKLTRTVAENSVAGTKVGNPVPAATDADMNDTLTYTLEGKDASSFNFDGSSRQLTTKAGVSYDHEAKASYKST